MVAGGNHTELVPTTIALANYVITFLVLVLPPSDFHLSRKKVMFTYIAIHTRLHSDLDLD